MYSLIHASGLAVVGVRSPLLLRDISTIFGVMAKAAVVAFFQVWLSYNRMVSSLSRSYFAARPKPPFLAMSLVFWMRWLTCCSICFNTWSVTSFLNHLLRLSNQPDYLSLEVGELALRHFENSPTTLQVTTPMKERKAYVGELPKIFSFPSRNFLWEVLQKIRGKMFDKLFIKYIIRTSGFIHFLMSS